MTAPCSLVDLEQQLKFAREASLALSALSSRQKDQALRGFSESVAAQKERILTANRADLAEQEKEISASLFQRLKLDEAKLFQLQRGILDVASLADPVGRVLERTLLDEGLILEKCSVPLGVLGIVFEARPDVLPQIAALALKSGNAVVLKGGREAQQTNQAFAAIVADLGVRFPFLPRGWLSLLKTREEFQALLAFHQYVDLVIPRGSKELIHWVMSNTRIPVLGHADGICHLYVHRSARLEQAVRLALDAKTQYPAACNSIETLLVDEPVAGEFFESFVPAAQQKKLLLKGCPKACMRVPGMPPAAPSDFGQEFGCLTLAIKIVPGLREAIAHINTFGSHHTDSIAAEDPAVIEEFLARVDSAGVYANASTRFADGYRYGFGAEVGISTSRTHARGPVGLEGLVTYKYKLRGAGHIVEDYIGDRARPFIHRRL